MAVGMYIFNVYFPTGSVHSQCFVHKYPTHLSVKS